MSRIRVNSQLIEFFPVYFDWSFCPLQDDFYSIKNPVIEWERILFRNFSHIQLSLRSNQNNYAKKILNS